MQQALNEPEFLDFTFVVPNANSVVRTTCLQPVTYQNFSMRKILGLLLLSNVFEEVEQYLQARPSEETGRLERLRWHFLKTIIYTVKVQQLKIDTFISYYIHQDKVFNMHTRGQQTPRSRAMEHLLKNPLQYPFLPPFHLLSLAVVVTIKILQLFYI